jgi:hypothetical protein
MSIGVLRFYNARIGVSGRGLEISQLGSGVFDHLGSFGPNGNVSAVEVNSFQDTTLIVDEDGNPLTNHLGGALPFGGSGYLTNNKRVGASGVSISGLPLGPYNVNIADVNVFNPLNLSTPPDFVNRPSGTLLITYQASGISQTHTYNAKFFAFDATGAITDPPPDVSVFAFEINASGQTFSSATSGVWQQTQGQNNPIFLVNRSPSNGWRAENLHYFVLGLSVRPNAVGVLNDITYGFSLQFA